VAAGDGFAVADVLGQTAYVCDSEGTRTHVLDRETVPDAALALPESVAWDGAKSRLYVTDSASGTVVVFNVRAE
jgi:sugar lactone lactonase YvrE